MNLISFFDSKAAKYKSAFEEIKPLADGYLPTHVLADQLCARSVIPNPVPCPQIPVAFTAAEVLGCISTSEVGKVAQLLLSQNVMPKFTAQDRAGVADFVSVCAAAGLISTAESASISKLLNRTLPDPEWKPTIHGPSDLQSQFGISGINLVDIDLALGRITQDQHDTYHRIQNEAQARPDPKLRPA